MTRLLLASLWVFAAGCGRTRSEEPRMLGLIPADVPSREAKLGPFAVVVLAHQFEEAQRLMRAGKWDEAKVLLERIQQDDPTYRDGAVLPYLAKAEREAEVQTHLAMAETHLDAKELLPAWKELQQVPVDTLQANARERVEARVAVEVEALVFEGKALTAFNAPEKMERLRGIVDVLAVVAPRHEELIVLRVALAR